MAESVVQRINATRLDTTTKRQLTILLQSVVTDLTAIKTNLAGLTAKMDADAGITDTNYTALWATTLSFNTTN